MNRQKIQKSSRYQVKVRFGAFLAIWLLLSMAPFVFDVQAADAKKAAFQTEPTPGGQIVSEKPTGDPKLIVVRHYTVPEQVRALESFTLYLEIKNVGNVPAEGFTIDSEATDDPNIKFEDQSTKLIPTIASDESTTISFRLRVIEILEGSGSKSVKFNFKQPVDGKLTGTQTNPSVNFYVLEAIVIAKPTATLHDTFDKAQLYIGETWVTEARRTGYDMLTPVPVDITAQLPITAAGGPEFQFGVEIRNLGDREARNIQVDFCNTAEDATSKFQPTSSSCIQHIPGTLPPDGSGFTGQVLAYKDNTPGDGVDPLSRGQALTLTIRYEFQHAGRWVSEAFTETVFVYPQQFLAPRILVTPQPEAPPGAIAKVKGHGVRLRYGPSTNYEIIRLVNNGDELTIVGKKGDGTWWQVEHYGSYAWIYAGLVYASGADHVPVVTNYPPEPPPPSQGIHSSDSPANKQQAGSTEQQLNNANLRSVSTNSFGSRGEVVPLSYVETQNEGAKAGQQQSAASARPLILIEQYQVEPKQIRTAEPFVVELVLYNAGNAISQQLALTWLSVDIVPLGSGTTQWLDALAPRERVTIRRQFVTVSAVADQLVMLPLQLQYLDGTQNLVRQNETIALIPAGFAPDSVTSDAGEGEERPLWLRVVSGLIGLGAEPK